ncbi:MAG: hypothetical protein HC925_01250, partial [Coleofasciculaceae cyanobacterium SM2_3_26]|nr:hypothetical protein [Coleofasciculaceae cyanobacterium SM2_3_26]
DVFNYVLRLNDLEANRVGRTIFVARRLPNSAKSLIVRNIRINQVSVNSALNFLVALGAETAVSRERLVTSVNAVPIAQLEGAQQSAITQTQTTTEDRVEIQRVDFVDSEPLLRGLLVAGDERTNSLTLVGTPRQIEVAIAQLVQLDVRRRQVAVNVKVIDIDLAALDRFSSSFSFGVDDTRFINQGGIGILNFGSRSPATTIPPLTAPIQVDSGNLGTNVDAATGSFNFVRSFFAQLQAAVTNGSGKILTDPTVVVQEGQIAEVTLAEEVVTNFEFESTASGGVTTSNVTVETTPAGLTLSIQVDRIDDNGFVSLSVAPSITSPTATVGVEVAGNTNTITLLSIRSLSSGQIRLRDGQTLVLSGIIQDSDRTNITKVPILGDIPLLGALFRSTERLNERREVIVLLTPQIIDDSDRATYGYSYTPSREAQQFLQQNR